MKRSAVALLVSVVSLCMIVGCVDIPETPIEHYTGFVTEVEYMPETFWMIGLTTVTFSDGNVLILRGIQRMPQNHIVNISYYKKEWNEKPYYKIVSIEIKND